MQTPNQKYVPWSRKHKNLGQCKNSELTTGIMFLTLAVLSLTDCGTSVHTYHYLNKVSIGTQTPPAVFFFK
jgi:hypothetical protein